MNLVGDHFDPHSDLALKEQWGSSASPSVSVGRFSPHTSSHGRVQTRPYDYGFGEALLPHIAHTAGF